MLKEREIISDLRKRIFEAQKTGEDIPSYQTISKYWWLSSKSSKRAIYYRIRFAEVGNEISKTRKETSETLE